jgi:hypothetical protein
LSRDFLRVLLPKELVDQIRELISSRPELGYTDIREFVKAWVREGIRRETSQPHPQQDFLDEFRTLKQQVQALDARLLQTSPVIAPPVFDSTLDSQLQKTQILLQQFQLEVTLKFIIRADLGLREYFRHFRALQFGVHSYHETPDRLRFDVGKAGLEILRLQDTRSVQWKFLTNCSGVFYCGENPEDVRKILKYSPPHALLCFYVGGVLPEDFVTTILVDHNQDLLPRPADAEPSCLLIIDRRDQPLENAVDDFLMEAKESEERLPPALSIASLPGPLKRER